MRNIIAVVWMSLDGVVESPEQWAFAYSNDELAVVNERGMATSDVLLLGRVTYQEFAAYWPTQPDDVPMAAYLNRVPKVVVSTTLAEVAWNNATLIHGNVVAALTALKQQLGKNITTVGSATLVRSLLYHDLLDTLRVMVPPLVLGNGMRLFPDGSAQQRLTLVDSRTFSTGVVSLTYQPVRNST